MHGLVIAMKTITTPSALLGMALAAVSGVGAWLTSNLEWLLPLIPSVAIMAGNAYHGWRLAQARAVIQFEVEKAKARKAIRDTGETVPPGLEASDISDTPI